MTEFRIGHGYDVHKLVPERKLILGGVEIPHTLGLLGHSDADVLLHAVMDAVIGALGLGDIGKHFPDSDNKYKGISSMHLLTCVNKMLMDSGGKIVNIDATVIAQKPKLAPHIEKMRENISFALSCDKARINVKATTEEHLGFTGREEGISAHAVAMLQIDK
ncbi:MAG: 2-C-methyl-D-erythritol 2,4-cyclodiphosphate synthase [Clostridia bacterium]|nr:2-C-methyl-D-erythritol 2,4-cyclodiphosphate synthase [Clostridia bacterium]